MLHTWSRTLDYHPHAHLLVTAGGLSADSTAWIEPAHPRFLMTGIALSQIFRAKMHAGLTRAGLAHHLDPAVWQRAWTVHIQQIGRGQHAVRYLSRYVYRVALSNHSLERFDNQYVTFRYTHARTHKTRHLSLPVHPFIARFLQHVLHAASPRSAPDGLRSPARRHHLERARQLLESHDAATHGTTVTAAPARSTASASPASTPASSPAPCCPACQQPTLRFVQPLSAPERRRDSR